MKRTKKKNCFKIQLFPRFHSRNKKKNSHRYRSFNHYENSFYPFFQCLSSVRKLTRQDSRTVVVFLGDNMTLRFFFLTTAYTSIIIMKCQSSPFELCELLSDILKGRRLWKFKWLALFNYRLVSNIHRYNEISFRLNDLINVFKNVDRWIESGRRMSLRLLCTNEDCYESIF